MSPPIDAPDHADHADRACRHRASILRLALGSVLLLASDLVIKWLAFRHVAGNPIDLVRDADGQLPPIPAHDSVILIPKVLGLHLTVNHGAVFGLGQGGRWIFVLFSVVAMVVIGAVFARSRPNQRVLHLALAGVLAGALGNLYDRLVIGGVRDMFLLFPGVKLPFGWHWPGGADGLYPWIFNLADVCLVVGLAILMFKMYRADRASGAESKDDTT